MADTILDIETRFAGHGIGVREFVGGQLRQHLQATREIIALGDPATPLDTHVLARVNAAPLGGRLGVQGRWIADCPSCSGAEYVDFRNPIFMCCSCWNKDFGHQWLRVKVPKIKADIEAELLKRPAGNRHWEPNETLADLRRQNKEHGVT